jgi:transposase
VRLRHSTVREIGRMKNRLKSFLYTNGISYPEAFLHNGTHWSRRFMAWLKEDVHIKGEFGRRTLELLVRKVEYHRGFLLELNRELRSMMAQQVHAVDYALLRSVPGIGPVTAMSLLVELEDIRRFANSDHLASFIGIVPTRHSSGERDPDGELTFRRHELLRRMLVEASWIAVRNDPVLALGFSKACLKMKKNLAIIKVARKLVNRIAYVLRTREKYVIGVVK